MATPGRGEASGQNPAKKKYEAVVVPNAEQIFQQEIMDSCILRFFMSGLAGGAMGAVMGLVFGSFSLEMTPGEELIKRSMWETAKIHGKDALARAGSYAKGFAAFGAVYSTSECAIEKFRAKHDIYNSGYAGCFTGGILAVKSGPAAMAGGCAMCGAFSMAIEHFLQDR